MSIMLDEPSHIFPNLGSDCDRDFRFKKSIIDDQTRGVGYSLIWAI